MIKQNGYANHAFLYPLIVQQFVDDYNLTDGVAFDIGTGPGYLGIELAKITNMKICFLDINDEALETAKKSFADINANNEVEFIRTDVENMQVNDNTADFIMSRGSIWFWEDKVNGLKEIYRILKPGGVAVVGGGLGRYTPVTMRKRIMSKIKKRLEQKNETRPTLNELKDIMNKTGIKNFNIFSDGDDISGRWIEIRK